MSNLKNENGFYNNLLRVVVHDISTPMSVGTIVLKRLQKNLGDSKALSDLEKLGKAHLAVVQILDQVRSLLSVTSGKKTLTLVPCYLNELLVSTLELQNELAAKKGISILLKGQEAGVQIQVEPILFKSVILGNLISNAIKFSYESSRIEVLYGRMDSGDAFIRITDFGIGIPPDLLPILFDSSLPTHRVGTLGECGIGFGLPLVRLFLTNMGGDITVTSEAAPTGPRTCFEIRMPSYEPE